MVWASCESCQPTTNSATREAVELDLVAAAKKEQTGEHGFRLALPYSDADPTMAQEDPMRRITMTAAAVALAVLLTGCVTIPGTIISLLPLQSGSPADPVAP